MKYRLRYVISILVITLTACVRPAGTSSTIRITLPSAPNKLRKPAALGGTPTFCYFVNVTGSGIDQASTSCSPAQGVGSGFVDPLSTIEMSVPKGTGRTVELFGYVPGLNETCASLKSLSTASLNHLFSLAKKSGIDMSADQTTVELDENFPGLTQHYGLQASLPSGCYANLPPLDPGDAETNPAGFQLSAGSGLSVQQGATASTGVKLIGRIGGKIPRAVLTSVDGTKLEVH